MSKREKAAISVVIAAFTILIAVLLFSDFGISKNAERRSAEFVRMGAARTKIDCQIALNNPTKPLCGQSVDDQVRSQIRSEEELAAQKLSAQWTRIAGISALAALLTGFIGIILVYRTFKETQKSNEISTNSQRPWISVDFTPIDVCCVTDSAVHFSGNITVSNVGNTSAIHVKIDPGVFAGHMGANDNFESFISVRRERTGISDGFVLAPNEQTVHRMKFRLSKKQFKIEDNGEIDAYPKLFVVVDYSSLDGHSYQTGKGFQISHLRPDKFASGTGVFGIEIISGQRYEIPSNELSVSHDVKGWAR